LISPMMLSWIGLSFSYFRWFKKINGKHTTGRKDFLLTICKVRG
jgi:hypothetical protein